MGAASRAKGARGELELANYLTAEHGLDARRTAQLQSGRARPGDADVDVVEWPDVHVEAKRQETSQPLAWARQAEAACGSRMPVVVWRPSREPWRTIGRLDDLVLLHARARRGDQAAAVLTALVDALDRDGFVAGRRTEAALAAAIELVGDGA